MGMASSRADRRPGSGGGSGVGRNRWTTCTLFTRQCCCAPAAAHMHGPLVAHCPPPLSRIRNGTPGEAGDRSLPPGPAMPSQCGRMGRCIDAANGRPLRGRLLQAGRRGCLSMQAGAHRGAQRGHPVNAASISTPAHRQIHSSGTPLSSSRTAVAGSCAGSSAGMASSNGAPPDSTAYDCTSCTVISNALYTPVYVRVKCAPP